MKQKMIVMVVLVILVTYLTGGLVLASSENETSSSLPNKPQSTFSADHPIIDNLMEAIDELIETIRAYTEQVQEAVRDIISREEDEPEPVEEPAPLPEEEPEPVEEPAPLPEEEVPATGIVEGRLVDDDKDPLSRMRVIMGARETITDRNGFFFFEDVDFGSHELYLSDPNLQEEIFLTSFNIDENNPIYTVNLIVSLPDPDDEVEEVEVVPAPVEEPDGAPFLPFVIFAILIAAVISLFILRRKHIRIVDAKTGVFIKKQKIKIYPRTKIDLTDAFEYAYQDAVRVQFLRPAIKKLPGHRILFMKDEEIISEIEEYTGELEYLVELPEIPEEETPDPEVAPQEPGESAVPENQALEDRSSEDPAPEDKDIGSSSDS